MRRLPMLPTIISWLCRRRATEARAYRTCFRPLETDVNVHACAVSVIVPAYNVARYIAQALESVAIQQVPAEIIVVDDGSPDDIRAAIQDVAVGLPSLRYFRKENGGVAAARN